jgi:isopenicillin N synthase-like dioxygenase
MSYAASRAIGIDQIPVIDMGPALGEDPSAERAVAAAFRKAATEVGFFYIRNHGVDWTLVERAREAARRFFDLPIEEKNRVRVNENHRGFLRIGEARMADGVEPDLKESFVWGPEPREEASDPVPSNPFLCPNNWPAFDPGFREAVYPFFEAALDCGRRLLRIFAVGMDLPADTFTRPWKRPIARGSVIYYPPQPPGMGDRQFGVGPHTDYGCLTVLCQDDVGGLEVQTAQGDWVRAQPIQGTFVVNVGDLLQRWTNDGFASTPHRVVNSGGRSRYSLVVAVDPDYETVVDPATVCGPGETPLYEPIRCGDYILQRFDRAFAYRRKTAG